MHWPVKGMRAEEKIGGDRNFRPKSGYQDLIDIFRGQLADADISVRTDTVVEEIKWRQGHAELRVRTPEDSHNLAAPRVLVTLPLAVLQTSPGETGAVRFQPALRAEKIEALKKLEMGKVIRVVLRFRHRFWDEISPEGKAKTLADMSFLFSEDQWFPTWWTTMPKKLPIITGWAPFRCAERLSGQSHDFVIEHALQTLGCLLHVEVRELERLLEAAYFHDLAKRSFLARSLQLREGRVGWCTRGSGKAG